METDWAENRAKIPTGRRARYSSAGSSTGLLDLRARQVPHAPRARSADGKRTEIYISHRGMEEVYTTRATPATTGRRRGSRGRRSRARGRVPAPADGAPRRAGREGAHAGAAGRRAAPRRAHESATTAPRRCARTSRSTAPGAASASRSTASASPSRTATAQKGLYFVRYVDPESRDDSEKDRGIIDAHVLAARPSDEARAVPRAGAARGRAAAQVNVLNKEGARREARAPRTASSRCSTSS